MAQKYSTTPSELLDISHPVDAYYLNRAVWRFGTAMDQDVDTAVNKAKDKQKQDVANRTMAKWLGADTSGAYGDPMKSSKGVKDGR
jgi:hypothetical protein